MALATQNTFNGGEMSPQVSFRIDQNKYPTGVKRMANMLPLTQGPVIRRPGMQFCGAVGNDSHKVRVIDFIFNETQAYALELGQNYIRVWFDGALVTLLAPVTTPYTEADLFDLSYSQSADIMYLCHRGYPIKRLERHDHNDWRLVDVVIGSSQVPPAAPTLVKTGGTGRNYSYVVTAVNDETNEESIASPAATIDAATTLSVSDTVNVKVPALAGVTLYNFYKDMTGSGVFGYIGSAAPAGGFAQITDRGAQPSVTDTPPKARNPFAGVGEYPSCVTFFQQRLWFGGSDKKPQTLYGSQTANFQNFNVSDPVKDDDAVTFTLASGRVNRVKWLTGARSLLVGTVGGEWSISGVDDGAITPTSIKAQNVSNIGVAPVRPIQISGRAMFVQGDGRTTREMTYDFASDTYIPKDQTVYAEHLFSGKRVVDWAFQQAPYSTFWLVLDDGSAAAYTYIVEHGVAGWSRHNTDGIVESVCCVPNGSVDDVYLVVKRGTHRYIERMSPYSIDAVFTDGRFADSHAVVTGPLLTVTGLTHLEGKTVCILADGAVVPQQVVTGGKIVLPRQATKVCVGLPYTSEITPLPAEMQVGNGSSLLQQRTINSFDCYLYNMSGGEYGLEGGSMYEMPTRDGGQRADVALDAFTGIRSFTLSGNASGRQSFSLLQSDPLPFNLFALSVNVEVGTR